MTNIENDCLILSERIFYMKQSIDHWFAFMGNQSTSDAIFASLAEELPSLCSLILDRSCRFQCQHCIFQKEGSIQSLPQADIVLKILRQLSKPNVVHEGRQLTSRQLPLLKAIHDSGYPIGIIESGTYTSLIEKILQSGLRFDWMDISIDGSKTVHNVQRASNASWGIAVNGLKQARKVVKSGGKVTSLFTITALNYNDVETVGNWIQDQDVDEWHLTTMSLRAGIEHVRATDEQLGVAVSQLMKVRGGKPKFLRIYNTQDLKALITILGKETFSKALKQAEVTQNALVLDIGFPLYFYPQSLAPGETLVIDVDGWWRLPYCIKYSLKELAQERDAMGRDISVFNVVKPDQHTAINEMYKKAVSSWRKYSGEDQLSFEQQTLQTYF